jgi:hypothetical protein
MEEKVKYLRRVGDESGHFFIATPALLARKGDFEPCEGPTPAPTPPKPKPGTGKFLRRRGAKPGDPYWAWTPALAAKEDEFIEYVPGSDKVETPIVGEGEAGNPPADLPNGIGVPNKPEEIVEGVTAANKQVLIVNAITNLDPEKDFTATGLPRADTLAEILGFPVSAAERDIAWQTYQREAGN